MINRIFKLAIAASSVAALPGLAHAAATTATGTASLKVNDVCSVTGSTIELGTFTVQNTWSDVGAALGSYNGATFTVGSKGLEYMNYGSVTCTKGQLFTLQIKGTATSNASAIKITIGTKTAVLAPHIKKLGTELVAGNTSWAGAGAGAQVHSLAMSGRGTGEAQVLLGHAPVHFPASTVTRTDVLGTVGIYSDKLTYTLSF